MAEAISEFALKSIFKLLLGQAEAYLNDYLDRDVVGEKIRSLVTSHESKVNAKLDKLIAKDLNILIGSFEHGKNNNSWTPVFYPIFLKWIRKR